MGAAFATHKILALIDPDGDGVADVLEWEAGTNPKDPASVPVLSLTDAKLHVVWGSGQSAAPGSLAPQPVVVQLSRGDGVLLKKVVLEASCLGGYFAAPASPGKNVHRQVLQPDDAARSIQNILQQGIFSRNRLVVLWRGLTH